ncbi:MAG: thioesterase family protein [Mucinivorans sp.]
MIVESHHTALAMGSGDMEVLATPAMIALMENVAMNQAISLCTATQTTVGTKVAILHTRATPMGAQVKATARLVSQEGRSLRFEVWAQDEKGEIGHGEHERFIVDREKFMAKL